MGSLQRQSMMKLIGSTRVGFAGSGTDGFGFFRGSFPLLGYSTSESEETSHGEPEESDSSSSVSEGSDFSIMRS